MHGENERLGGRDFVSARRSWDNDPPSVPTSAPHPHPEVLGAPMASPRRRSRSKRTAVLVLAIISAGAVLLCGLGVVATVIKSASGTKPFVVQGTGSAPAPSYPDIAPDAPVIMILEVTGTGKADITYNVNGTGGQQLGATLPWRKELEPFSGFTIVSMLAQIKSNSTSAAVRGKITYGAKVTECEGQGPFAVATCTADTQ